MRRTNQTRRRRPGPLAWIVVAGILLPGVPAAAEPGDTNPPAQEQPSDTENPRNAQPDDLPEDRVGRTVERDGETADEKPAGGNTDRGTGRTTDEQPTNETVTGLPPIVGELLELRLQAQLAITESELATARAEQARRRAEGHRFAATIARLRARYHQDILDRFAADLYRNEIGVALLVDVAEAGILAPERVGDAAQWTALIGRDRERIVAEAAHARDEAERLERAAETAQATAEAEEQEAGERRKKADATLASTETALRALVGPDFKHQLTVGPDGCPTSAPEGTLRGTAATLDVAVLCARSVALAPTPEAALAVKYAFRALGAAYACDGIGRDLPMRYDCSSLVARAYAEGAGLLTATETWIPTTRNLLPWDGASQAPWARTIEAEDVLPGDLVLYDTAHLASRHVVMVLADGYMLHVAECGDVANVVDAWGQKDGDGYLYLGTRRVDPNLARVHFDPGPAGDAPWLNDAVGTTIDALDPDALGDGETAPETNAPDETVGSDDERDVPRDTKGTADAAERAGRRQIDHETRRRIERHETERTQTETIRPVR